MSKRKYNFTREDFDRNHITVEWGTDGQPIIRQLYQVNKRNRGRQWSEIRKQNINITKHKYGEDRKIILVSIKIDGEDVVLPLSNIVWIYFNGSIGDNDVDHINDNPLDNRLENLQILTHKENLLRKWSQRNQYTCRWEKELRDMNNKEMKEEYRKYIKECDDKIAKILEEREVLREKVAKLTEEKSYLINQKKMTFKAYLGSKVK